MRRICPIIIAASLMSMPACVFAADGKGVYAIDGGGGAACKAFTDARKAGNERAGDLFAGWLDGYVSAANQTSPETFDLTPWQTSELLLALLARYCETYPDDRFEIAVNNLLRALRPQRLSTQSEQIIVGGEGKGIAIYREVLRRAQQSLAAQGLYSSAIDGNYGDSTRKALTAFQEKNALKVTGLPDMETLYRLLPLSAAP